MRHTGPLALVAAAVLYAGSRVVRRFGVDETLFGVALGPPTLLVLTVAAVALAAYSAYRLVADVLLAHTASKRRRHDVRNVLRLAFGVLGLLAGFAINFALQGALASLVGWLYVGAKRPYGVCDRIAIEDTCDTEHGHETPSTGRSSTTSTTTPAGGLSRRSESVGAPLTRA